MFVAGAGLLEQNKKYVDSLNVFPVPDGDTGTNMFLTVKSAVNELSQCITNDTSALSQAFAKGALKGARGNSGVITSQIFKGFCNEIGKVNEVTTKVFAKAMQEGANIAYKAVTKPKEGTILTVIRVMAENAVNVAKKCDDFEVFLKKVLEVGEGNVAARAAGVDQHVVSGLDRFFNGRSRAGGQTAVREQGTVYI